uniref:Reverse transcriptase domain-containing protein n=1 Tax=Labrus bergylta TaxID=56723 RepID=A0A3Q3E968_9LABR
MEKCQPKNLNKYKFQQVTRCSKPCNDTVRKQQLRENYRQAQFTFDKKIRFYKRKFSRGQSLRLDYLQTNNPQQFWREINKLGPRRIQKIPVEVVLSNDVLECRKEFVIKKWKTDFADLFSGSNIPPIFEDAFLEYACKLKDDLERNMGGENYSPNLFLNYDITLEEVKTAINKSKLKKAVGVEEIPNEVLKSPPLLNIPLALEIKNANLGIHLNDLTVGTLLYADDIALLAESEDDLQNMLNLVKTWCCRWRLSINQSKTQIIHFRKKAVPRSEKNLVYSTYSQLYDACVSPLLIYAAGVWGFKEKNFRCSEHLSPMF